MNSHELLFQTLLTNPEKRAKVLELLTQEGLVQHSNKMTTPTSNKNNIMRNNSASSVVKNIIKRNNKVRLESPSALYRRRALKQMESECSSDGDRESKEESPLKGDPVAFECILKGVVAYCEVRKNGTDRSSVIKAMMQAMGADVQDTFTRAVTHVVFKDGSFTTYQKAKLLKVHLVSVLWLDAVKRHRFRVPEIRYPALGIDTCDANISLICQTMQSEYNDIVRDEKGRRSHYKLQEKKTVDDSITNRRRKTLGLERSSSSVSTAVNKDLVRLHNETALSTPYKHRCATPAISESDSCASDIDNRNKNDDNIVPSSQPDLAKYAKDSLELKRSMKIRSPKNHVSVSSDAASKSHSRGKEVDEEEDSLRLHITTTDESRSIEQKSPSLVNHTHEGGRELNKQDIADLTATRPSKNSSSLLSSSDKRSRRRRTVAAIKLSQHSENQTEETPPESGSAKKDEGENCSKTVVKPKPRLRKLYNPNQTLDENLFNWDDDKQTEKENVVKNQLPTRKVKQKIQIPKTLEKLPKTLSVKAQQKVTEKAVQNRRSVRALNFNELSVPDEKTKTKSDSSPKISPLKRKPAEAELTDDESSSDSPVSNRRSKKSPPAESTPSRRKSLRKAAVAVKEGQKEAATEDKNQQQRRSTLDFTSGSSRYRAKIRESQKSISGSTSIVCTRMKRADVQVFEQIVRKLGRFVVEDEVTKRTSHLVAGAPGRTINMLRALARGCWILTQEWLYKSLEAGKWIPEEDYEIVEFSPTVQKMRVQRQCFGAQFSMDIFADSGPIFVARSATPRFSDLEELVILAGGTVVKTPRQAKIVIAQFVRTEGTVCVTEKWLLDSITENRKKSFKNYLFAEETTVPN